MKINAGNSSNTKELDITVDDTALVRQKKKSKWSATFDPKLYCVTRLKGTMTTAVTPAEHYITKTFFKKVALYKSFDH